MDGLLIDSEPLWVRAEREVFAAAGVRLEEADCAKTKGLRIDDVISYWDAQRGFDPSLAKSTIEERLVRRVVELIHVEGSALPGVNLAIAAARSIGRVALASSSPPPIIEAALDRLGLVDAFDVALSAVSESHGKPHPAIFLRAAARLDVSPLDCVVIEDSMTGIIAAKAARMGCVAVPFDYPNHEVRFALADAIVGSLEDVTTSLLQSGLSRR